MRSLVVTLPIRSVNLLPRCAAGAGGGGGGGACLSSSRFSSWSILPRTNHQLQLQSPHRRGEWCSTMPQRQVVLNHNNKTTTTTTTTTSSTIVIDIEDLHRAAVEQNQTTYLDPTTGFTVFTALAHLRRGRCCGNRCRHCPYGWVNVVPPVTKVQERRRSSSNGSSSDSSDSTGNRSTMNSTTGNPTRRPVVDVSTMQPTGSNEEERSPSGLPQAESMAAVMKAVPDTEHTNPPSNKRTGGRRGGRLTTKNVPYTRGGDKGMSSLLTGERRSKIDPVFEAMGTVDELCSVVGVVHAELGRVTIENDGKNDNNNNNIIIIKNELLQEWLLEIMSRLFDIGTLVGKPPREDDDESASTLGEESSSHDHISPLPSAQRDEELFDPAHVDTLEDWIDSMTEELPELHSFILPTGSPAAAQLHVARTVCRRAERRVVAAAPRDPTLLQYLNRLSDFFFTAARYVNHDGHDEILYRRPTRDVKQRTRVIRTRSDPPGP